MGKFTITILIWVSIILLAFLLVRIGRGTEIESQYHITGCEYGELIYPVVNIWSEPGRGKIIGKLSGNSSELKCQGSIVIILEMRKVNCRIFYKIKTIDNKIGWVIGSFIGMKEN